MHTKVFQIGAAVVLLAFLSGVGSGAIAVYKPQNIQESATSTSNSALDSNSANSCTIGPASNLSSTSSINFLESTTNNFFQTRSNLLSILSSNFPEASASGLQSPTATATNSAITTLSPSLIPYSTTNTSITQPTQPFITSLRSLSLAIPPVLAGLAVLGLISDKKKINTEGIEIETEQREEGKNEAFKKLN